MDSLTLLALKNLGCYKVILDCGSHNIKFYEACGYTQKEVQMVQYSDKLKYSKI